jgi:limonene 1,2-monooxygenase
MIPAAPVPGIAAPPRQSARSEEIDRALQLRQSLDVIMRLLAGDEPVTFKNHRWDLRDARLHLRPYSNPLFDVAVAAVASPTGAKLAGRHGIGLLSVGATTAAGFDALALHWDVLGEEARVHGKTVDRSNWRLVGPMHCAETKEQAIADVQYGIEHWFRYFQAVAAFPQMAVLGDSAAEMIDFINKSRKRLNGGTLHLPNRTKDLPHRERLALRFERFKAVA